MTSRTEVWLGGFIGKAICVVVGVVLVVYLNGWIGMAIVAVLSAGLVAVLRRSKRKPSP